MGKRARKTRWRALDIADEHSDSEESNTNSSAVSRVSNSTGYYSSKYSYSSQSTPARRRYNPYDGSVKSTRSSSTTSETKITFNEDEYTRITTPRQDVLFKKGYLNKPKTYQTQTSTGNSTISTGNSTENGTPDHQSTDLDYESQFMFPNGFVDQHGIYYVNSYEPYPLMLFNPPTYYQEFSNTKAKRYSTGSLSESMSPNNEEATSQDMSQSGGEASNSGVSDYSGPPIFNMVYPGYYVNGACTPTGMTNGCHHCPSEPVKKLKKRRERKSSKTIPGDSSEFTDENSSDEQVEKNIAHRVRIPEDHPQLSSDISTSSTELTTSDKPSNDSSESINGCADQKTESINVDQKPSSVLKPDAEEFVPRAYHHHQALGAPLKMLPPNFMPIPMVPISDFTGQTFAPHPAFIPPGFPINFMPHPVGQKIYHAAPTFTPPIVQESNCEEPDSGKIEESTVTPSHTPVVDDNRTHSIDIATVVSKLNAVVRQELPESPTVVQKPSNFKRNHYNRYRNSAAGRSAESTPQSRSVQESPRHQIETHERVNIRNSLEGSERKHWKTNQFQNNKLASPQRHFNNRNNYSESARKFHPTSSPVKNINIEAIDLSKSELVKQKSSPSQWISVSSRKKKKVRPMEESETDNNNLEDDISEGFESYDVDQLVDVIPPSQLAEKRIENILTSIAQNESKAVVTPPNVDIPEVSEIEKDIIVKIEEEAKIIALQEEVESAKVAVQEDAFKAKKKSKKGTQKPLMKKVIITDIFEEPAVEVTKETIKKVAQIKEPSPEPEVESADKKSKKKKKNKSKSTPASFTTEDSYEVLLATDTQDKSTDDISFELDKLIQKGMFNSLQSKIQESDDFFKSLGPLLAPTPAKPSSTTSSTPDYNRIFQSTRQFLKPNMVSVEHDIKVDSLRGHIKSSSSTADTSDPAIGPHLTDGILRPEPAKEDIQEVPPSHPECAMNNDLETCVEFHEDNLPVPEFGDVANVNESLKDIINSVELDLCDPVIPVTIEQYDKHSEENIQFPITLAVKEWMSKTRETTPDVEILKSPEEIYKEIIDLDDEEVTLFDSQESLDEADLLEFWDNDLTLNCDDFKKDSVESGVSEVCVDDDEKCCIDKIKLDDNEEEIEVYESKYGKNETLKFLGEEKAQKVPHSTGACCTLQ